MRLIRRRLIRFGLVGVVGYIVDSAVLLTVIGVGANLYAGRVVSFLFAVTATWYFNRVFTFRDRSPRLFQQWASFASVNTFGGLVNYGTFALLVWKSPFFHSMVVLAVAISSLAGMIFNYFFSKTMVFSEAGSTFDANDSLESRHT